MIGSLSLYYGILRQLLPEALNHPAPPSLSDVTDIGSQSWGHFETLVANQIISYKRRKILRFLSVSSAAKKNLEAKKAANIQKEIDRNYTEKKAKQQFIEEQMKLISR